MTGSQQKLGRSEEVLSKDVRVTIESDLAGLALFSDWDGDRLSRLAAMLMSEQFDPGQLLMRQGELGTSFLLMIEGMVTASRSDRSGSHTVGTAGRGSILGELALLTHGRRHATVTAKTSVRAASGDEMAFELLLEAPGMKERLSGIAAQRFAAVSDAVPVALPDATRFLVRPMLPSDRQLVVTAFARQSQESIRRRFFTAATPDSRIIDYLVDIDYIDHFAWGVSTLDGRRGVAEARYIRLSDDEEAAEIAFDVLDEYQGRGLGTFLLGALAVAATNAGIARFVADVLYENRPMLAVFKKAGTTLTPPERGVVRCSMDVSASESLIEDPPRTELARTARRVVTAAGLALHQ